MSSRTRWNVVFVLGPPGCGKGTQCGLIAKNFGYVHLSAGDLLREEQRREGSQYGQLIANHIKNGTIVPVEITCKLLENAMLARGGVPAGFLVDGFPRNKDNFDGWMREMGEKTNLKFVLFLHCEENVCYERCLSRCEGRTDDNVESLKKRIQGYFNVTMPIIEHYSSLNLVRKVDAANSREQVFEDVKKHFLEAGVDLIPDT